MEKLFGGAVVWQFPAASETQMMGYAVECEDKLILIDGGTASEAPFLKEFLKSRKKVDGWFITHAHADHRLRDRDFKDRLSRRFCRL